MPGPKSDKVWADAIRKQVHEYHEETDASGKVKIIRYLNLLAANLIKAAASGDMQAMKEVGDRLDGKPAQAVALGNDGDGPLKIEIIRYSADDNASG